MYYKSRESSSQRSQERGREINNFTIHPIFRMLDSSEDTLEEVETVFIASIK